jgi:hypothetical protein
MLLVVTACASHKNTMPLESFISGGELKVIGRFSVEDHTLELISSGAHFGITFEGSQCTILGSITGQHHNYIQYELDGHYQTRIKMNEGLIDTLKITAPTSGKHTLWVFKATEAHTGPIFIHKVIGNKIQTLDIPKQPIIEFIGNSITCGALADPSLVPCGSGSYHDQHNAYLAYGPRVTRALNANFILSSVSGIGVYRNWNSDSPVMPQVYDRTDLQEGSRRAWNFNLFTPKIASIALGTNDFSNGDGVKPRLPFDSAQFTIRYISFIKTVKSKYPKAVIALLNSPMISGTNNEILVDCLTRVKHQIDQAYPLDKPIQIFQFKPMIPRGCSYHPSVEDHKEMAVQLIPFFSNLLNSN